MDTIKNFPRSPIAILSLALLIVITTLFATAFDEIQSLHEMRHIVRTDFRYSDEGTQIEAQHHLETKISTSHHLLIMISSSLVVLIIGWLGTNRAMRRLKKIAFAEKRLEELLYADQVRLIHNNTSLLAKLPSSFVRLQQDRDLFNKALAQALAKQEFVLHFQPIIQAQSGQIVEVEALLRWQHPSYGLLSPDLFIPLCENTGFIVPLGDWILQAACRQLKIWHAMGHAQLGIAINLSPVQLKTSNFLDGLNAMTQNLGIAPECIKLEVTESMVMQNTIQTGELLKALKQLGIKLSLDDFGTKYSSLTYLKEFPFDIIKIDKSFVRDMVAHEISFAIVESIASLGKSLGLTVIAEGVDHHDQATLLKTMQCDRLQGYLYSKPLPALEFTQLLTTSTAIATPSVLFAIKQNEPNVSSSRKRGSIQP